MKRLTVGLVVLWVGAGTVLAQGLKDPREEWAKAHRHLQQSRVEVERLVDRRFRHDLGLPPEADPTMPRRNPMSTFQKDEKLRQLREANGMTASLLGRFNDLKGQVEAFRAEAEARAGAAAEQEFVVPSAGTAARTMRQPTEAIDGGRAGISEPGTGTIEPVVPNNAAQRAGSPVAIRLGRVQGQIRGSKDHLRVAQSLFKAGQALMDYAKETREEGADEAAVELDKRAKQRLERAIAELEPLLRDNEPSFAALFCKGRCLELLFRYSTRYDGLSLRSSTKLFQQREQAVREPFLAISARDVQKGGASDELEILGSWGMAANAAVEHFRWMNQRGSYNPTTPVESITWPGEKDQ